MVAFRDCGFVRCGKPVARTARSGHCQRMYIRCEQPGDADAIHAVHTAAFSRPETPSAEVVEARLVDELRAEGDLISPLSLVAVEKDTVVAHVCCSTARLGESGDNRAFVGLGPLGVLPENQLSGCGSALMHAVIAAADALRYEGVVLLGDPAYYSRFGFVLSAEHAIDPPVAAWTPHFQLRTLAAYRTGRQGTFQYAPAFDRV